MSIASGPTSREFCLAIDPRIPCAFDQFTVTLWNPTIHPVLEHFRVPVTRAYTVRDSTGQPILSEVSAFELERAIDAFSHSVFRSSPFLILPKISQAARALQRIN